MENGKPQLNEQPINLVNELRGNIKLGKIDYRVENKGLEGQVGKTEVESKKDTQFKLCAYKAGRSLRVMNALLYV